MSNQPEKDYEKLIALGGSVPLESVSMSGRNTEIDEVDCQGNLTLGGEGFSARLLGKVDIRLIGAAKSGDQLALDDKMDAVRRNHHPSKEAILIRIEATNDEATTRGQLHQGTKVVRR